jgi:MtN3 and saliva related transmembrane protein
MEVIGWLSSAILVMTIGKQVHKQYKARSSDGVSSWLFIGQMAASAGFTIYSWLVHNWVFVVTNAIMLCSAIAGYVIYRQNLPRGSESSAPGRGSRRSQAAL